jgi:cephalosporin-C deacetylase-like acetyl esterase/ketosteroid isomerase-like protein
MSGSPPFLRQRALRARWIAFAIGAQLLTAAPAGGQAAGQTDLFAYEREQELDVQTNLAESYPGAKVFDLSYASPKGGRVTAYLVAPEAPGPHAGVLFGHWGGGERSEFLPEAILYARAGVVSLLPDYPWTRPAPWRKGLRYSADPQHDFEVYVRAVVDLRRGLDLLCARPDVDPERLAYVGHSYGAQWGAILTAVDRRMRASVLVAGVPDLAALYLESSDPDCVELRATDPARVTKLLEVMEPLAAKNFVARAAPIPLLFQFARFEQAFPRAAMERYFAAASEPKELRWYPTGHDLNDPQALLDRAAWLRERIRMGAVALPEVRGASSEPSASRSECLAALVSAERAFARTNAELGQCEAWLRWFAEDGVMFRPGPALARAFMGGKPEPPPAPPGAFDWRPTYGDVSHAGDLGYNAGPVRLASVGKSDRFFFSVWRRESAGWRVVLDLGTEVALETDPFDDVFEAAPSAAAPERPATSAELLELERSSLGSAETFLAHLDPAVRGLRWLAPPLVGSGAFREWFARQPSALTHEPAGGGIASSQDLGYTYGRYHLGGAAGEHGHYARAWRRDARGAWRIVFDVARPEAGR